jgi:hypothetical protein
MRDHSLNIQSADRALPPNRHYQLTAQARSVADWPKRRRTAAARSQAAFQWRKWSAACNELLEPGMGPLAHHRMLSAAACAPSGSARMRSDMRAAAARTCGAAADRRHSAWLCTGQDTASTLAAGCSCLCTHAVLDNSLVHPVPSLWTIRWGLGRACGWASVRRPSARRSAVRLSMSTGAGPTPERRHASPQNGWSPAPAHARGSHAQLACPLARHSWHRGLDCGSQLTAMDVAHGNDFMVAKALRAQAQHDAHRGKRRAGAPKKGTTMVGQPASSPVATVPARPRAAVSVAAGCNVYHHCEHHCKLGVGSNEM